jgi:hypothetical protein
MRVPRWKALHIDLCRPHKQALDLLCGYRVCSTLLVFELSYTTSSD